VTRRRVLFIANPRARGLARAKRLEAAVEAVAAEADLDARLVWTARPGHAGELAHAAAEDGSDLIFACGGDGTLNEVLNGLPDRAPADLPPIGVVPGGTVNVWAREAGIARRRPGEAIRAQLRATPLAVDLGRVGPQGEAGRRFLLMVSFGFDAAAVASVNPGLKRRVGPLAYMWAGLRTFWRYPGFDADLVLDGATPERVHTSMLVVGNTRNYGGSGAVTVAASAIDGQLDYVGLLGHGFWTTARLAPQLLLRRHLGSRQVIFRRAGHGLIVPREGGLLPHLQLDGEIGLPPSPGPIELSVEPSAVRMLVPKPDQGLFRPPSVAP